MEMDSCNCKKIYSDEQEALLLKDFHRLQGQCYLDNAGAALYSEQQISGVFHDFTENVYANPHTNNFSSKLTQDLIDQMRYKVLSFFSANLQEYSVIFTSGATAALKLVGECFQYTENSEGNANETGELVYLTDNHTSVLGMREYAPNIFAIKPQEAVRVLSNESNKIENVTNSNSLFVYPAQSNFCGTKYPLAWIEKVQNNALNGYCNVASQNWFVLLDAASFVSTNALDLSKHKPDFVAISFYKIFGYPTGLGALIVKNESAYVLKKKYYGGGTVLMALSLENLVVNRPTVHENFEDGTLPFLSIAALKYGFQTFERFRLCMTTISEHTFELARYIFNNLRTYHHYNGQCVAKVYQSTEFASKNRQGGIVNFNLFRSSGDYVGFSEILHVSNLYGIHLRTGCFCNPGACQLHLKLSSEDVKHHFNQGHVCGDQIDLIDGRPTGSVRISFGYMSTKNDADTFLRMIENYFICKPIVRKVPTIQHETIERPKFNANVGKSAKAVPQSVGMKELNVNYGVLRRMFVYPVKSCGAYEISSSWKLVSTGLKYDRSWMIVNSNGVCVTQKHDARLCLIKPDIDLTDGFLRLHFEEQDMQVNKVLLLSLKLKNTVRNLDACTCNSKVCGDRIQGVDCGDEAARWLSEVLDISGLRLLRQYSFDETRASRLSRKGVEKQLSLSNECQFLLLNEASVQWLLDCIPKDDFEDNLDGLTKRFRPNFVVRFSESFVENFVEEFRLNDCEFKCEGPCTRCHMICIDQSSAQKSAEPLKTLSSMLKGKIRFGVYLKQSESFKGKRVCVGDAVIAK